MAWQQPGDPAGADSAHVRVREAIANDQDALVQKALRGSVKLVVCHRGKPSGVAMREKDSWTRWADFLSTESGATISSANDAPVFRF
jgi:hypothetical protein